MLDITLDIETIPDQRRDTLDKLIQSELKGFKAPSGLTKEAAITDLVAQGCDGAELKPRTKSEVIELWQEIMAPIKAEEQAEEKWLRTSLNGGYGNIYCIGLAFSDEPPQVLVGTESQMLHRLFDEIGKAISRHQSNKQVIKFIGHNIEWDLRFIHQRAIINGIKPCVDLIHSRYSQNMFDTMQEWAGYGNRIKLGELCEILDVPTPKDDIDGSQVWATVEAGDGDRVIKYCASDVEATRLCYKKMTHSMPELDSLPF